MDEKVILYNGNNQKYFDEMYDRPGAQRFWLPGKVTTNPWESVEFAFQSSQRHSSRPVVIVVKYDLQFYCELETVTYGNKWSQKRKNAKTREERDSQIIRTFTESELEEFLKFADISTDRREKALRLLIADLNGRQGIDPQPPQEGE